MNVHYEIPTSGQTHWVKGIFKSIPQIVEQALRKAEEGSEGGLGSCVVLISVGKLS